MCLIDHFHFQLANSMQKLLNMFRHSLLATNQLDRSKARLFFKSFKLIENSLILLKKIDKRPTLSVKNDFITVCASTCVVFYYVSTFCQDSKN